MLKNISIIWVNVVNKSTRVLPSSFLLKFGALLDSSTDTRQLSAVSFILPADLTHLIDKQVSIKLQKQLSFNVYWHLQHETLMQIDEIH